VQGYPAQALEVGEVVLILGELSGIGLGVALAILLMLVKLADELSREGIALSMASVEDEVRDRLRLAGVEEAIGAERIFDTLDEGVAAFEART